MRTLLTLLLLTAIPLLRGKGAATTDSLDKRWQNERIVALSYNDNIPVYFQSNWRLSNGVIVQPTGDVKTTRKCSWRDTILVVDTMTYINNNKDAELIQITHHEIDFSKRQILRLNITGWGDTMERAIFRYDKQGRLERMIRNCHPGFTAAQWPGEQFRFEYGPKGLLSEVICEDRTGNLLAKQQFKVIRFDTLEQWLVNETRGEVFEFALKGDGALSILEYETRLAGDKPYHSVDMKYRLGDTLVLVHAEGPKKSKLFEDAAETMSFQSKTDGLHYLESYQCSPYPAVKKKVSYIVWSHTPPKGESWNFKYYVNGELDWEVQEMSISR